ncbi:hypothetical protein E3T55_16515 [Cryobacterium frigoriphilum]|uniref:DUF1801 domain-containing protein n=1 Tax=Cryobacterium frigoriphilum TaxID=1259150 RepID=A0A4R8ZVA9_9MICO|nr:hypothetical protein [Cryobacterium frigoriphilum]TFD46972.1 hypothetical protein E3T55_16515 [Cryobacterium frigoriphilum]
MSDTHTGFSEAERDAMQQRAAELKAMKGVKGSAKKAKELEACLAAIEKLTGTDRIIAERLHMIVVEEAPQLDAKTWYGFPTYAKAGRNIVFFQPAAKFGARYGTVGFEEYAALDEGEIWPVAYAVIEMTPAAETQLRVLVKRAVA